MIGKEIGNFKIVEKIGEGGMGAVYRGLDVMLEREVAIKMLRPELSSQPDVVERFRTEAVTLAKLNHPNIATLYSFMRDGEDFFMIMEFVRGQSLDDVIRRFGAMSVERAILLIGQALEGLDHAHRMGIIHRDIKPANLMVTDEGAIKVMDFGIARMLGTARLTRQGNVVGTIEYMSPEQVRAMETDARSDVYSMGIVLYEMVTGRVPFSSTSEFELMKAQVEQAPPPPRSFAAHIPLQIEQALMRSIAKKPEARYQTAGEFRATLLGTLGSTSGLGHPGTGKYAAPATRMMEAPAGQFTGDKKPDLDPSKQTVVDGSSVNALLTANGADKTQALATEGAKPESVPPTPPGGSLSRAAETVESTTFEAGLPATEHGNTLALDAEPPAADSPSTSSLGSASSAAENGATTMLSSSASAAEAAAAKNATPKNAATVMIGSPALPAASPTPEAAAPEAAAPVAPSPVASSPAAPATAAPRRPLNGKIIAAAVVVVLALASVPFVLKAMRAKPPAPAVEEAPPTENPNPTTEEITPLVTNPTDTAATNANEAPADTATGNANANANNSRAARRPTRNENASQAAAPTEEPQTQPDTTPPVVTPPATTPPVQTTPTPDPNAKVQENKNTEKKKGGGVGGFFKKIFGGGGDKDKKKNENKKP